MKNTSFGVRKPSVLRGRLFSATDLQGRSVAADEQLLAVNLTPGEAKKLTITANQEEGFDGQIAVIVDGLPAGVQVLAAAEVEPDRGPSFAKLHPERFLPKSQKITLVMIAGEDAPITTMPRFINVKARPIVSGKLGPLFPVRTIPVMVVKPKTGAAERASGGANNN